MARTALPWLRCVAMLCAAGTLSLSSSLLLAQEQTPLQPASQPPSPSQGVVSLRQLAAAATEPARFAVMEQRLGKWLNDDQGAALNNRVKHAMESGTLAFLSGERAMAEALFTAASQEIDTIYSDHPDAVAARSNFVPEMSKPFKGDPYERAMVNYYLGLIDLYRGDWDNARASFRNALFQDTMSASEAYQSDMAAMEYLVGWTLHCEGRKDEAQEHFTRATQWRPALTPPSPSDTALLIAETGNAPLKRNAGEWGEVLQYRPNEAVPAVQVVFRAADNDYSAVLAEDLYWQASTRGGAAIDGIRQGKASFRSNTDEVTNVAKAVRNTSLEMGAAMGGDGGVIALGIGLVAGVVGLVGEQVAKNTETQADSRAWESLPAFIHLASAPALAGAPVQAGFYDQNGNFLWHQKVNFHSTSACAVGHVRARSRAPASQPSIAADTPTPPAPWNPIVALTETDPRWRTPRLTDPARVAVPVPAQAQQALQSIRALRQSAAP